MSEATLHELRESIQTTVEADIPYFQRLARLRAVEQELADGQAEVQEAIREIGAAAVAEMEQLQMAALSVRERATTTERLLAEGALDQSDVKDSGLFLHADLDRLEGEGLFEATVQQLVDEGVLGLDGAWIPA